MAEIPTRKHCAVCGHWLLVCINFRPRAWSEDGSRPTYVSGDCNSCHKGLERARHVPKITPAILKLRRDEEFFVIHNKLDAAPFRLWLQQRCQEIGVSNVSASVGASQRMIYTYVTGRYKKKHWTGEWREYHVKFVQLATVDRFAQGLGYRWDDIYPELADVDVGRVKGRLRARGEMPKKKNPVSRHDDASEVTYFKFKKHPGET